MAFNKGKVVLCSVGLLFLMALTFSVYVNAAAPTSEEEVPLVPGSMPDRQEEALWKEQGWFGGISLFIDGSELPLITEDHAFYSVNTPLEDVARYYAKEFDAVESYNTGEDLETLAAGETTPVYVEYTVYDREFEDEYDYSGKLLRSGAMVRDMLIKNRKPWVSGGWLSRAYFSWVYRDFEGNVVQFDVDCEDRSFSNDYAKFQGTKTLITIHSYTFMSEEDVWEMEDEAMDAEIAALAREMALSPPTSESLGMPLYPDAEFQPEISAGMSLNDQYMYIFLTTDTPTEVIRWYEQKTGKTAESWAADSYSIAISGQMPFPDKGLTVQPNMLFGGQWQTVVTLVTTKEMYDDWND